MIKKWMYGLMAAYFFFSVSSMAGEPDEILEQQSSGVRTLVTKINKSLRAGDPYSNPEGLFIMEGCYGGKKGDEFENKVVDVRALYYSELFKRNTKQITRVHLLFKKPVA